MASSARTSTNTRRLAPEDADLLRILGAHDGLSRRELGREYHRQRGEPEYGVVDGMQRRLSALARLGLVTQTHQAGVYTMTPAGRTRLELYLESTAARVEIER